MRRSSLPVALNAWMLMIITCTPASEEKRSELVQERGVVAERLRLTAVAYWKCSAVMANDLCTPSRIATLGTTTMNFDQP